MSLLILRDVFKSENQQDQDARQTLVGVTHVLTAHGEVRACVGDTDVTSVRVCACVRERFTQTSTNRGRGAVHNNRTHVRKDKRKVASRSFGASDRFGGKLKGSSLSFREGSTDLYKYLKL